MVIKNKRFHRNFVIKNIKHIFKNTKIDSIKAIFLYSFIVVFYSNFIAVVRFIKYNFKQYNIFFAATYSLSGIFIMLALMSVIFFFCSFFGQKFLKFIGIVFVLSSSFYIYTVLTMNVFITSIIIQDILGGNGNDMKYVILNWRVIPCIIIFGIIPSMIIFKIKIEEKRKVSLFKYIYKYISVLLVFVVLAYLLCSKSFKTKYMDDIKKQIVPISILNTTKDLRGGYRHALCVVFNVCGKREKLREYNIDNFLFKQVSNEPIIGVFIIGESLRSDRLSVNGYRRKTTPIIDKLEKTDNLYVFPNVETCDVLTESSVRCLMSKNDLKTWFDKKRITTKAFSSVLTGLGFDTYFYGNQHSVVTDKYMKKFYDVKHHIVREDLQQIDGKRDGFYFDKYIVNHLNKNVKKNTIYVIHSEGNHQSYSTKYTEEQNKFGKECDSDEYDNATFAFDEFFGDLIKKFKNKNAFIMYVSDHGESFGEINPNTGEETWFHGTLKKSKAPKEQKNVPIIFWASDKYIKNNKEKIEILKKLKKDRFNIYFSHDNIWHSFLDCLDVKSQEIDTKNSICSKNFEIKPSKLVLDKSKFEE